MRESKNADYEQSRCEIRRPNPLQCNENTHDQGEQQGSYPNQGGSDAT